MKSSSSRPGPSTVSCSTPLHAPHRLGARSNGPLRPLLAWLPGRRSCSQDGLFLDSRNHNWKSGIRLRHDLVDRLSTSVSIRLWSRSSRGLPASRRPSSRLKLRGLLLRWVDQFFNGTDVLRDGGRARYACVYACAAPGCLSFSTIHLSKSARL
jgi:hypothetical protein